MNEARITKSTLTKHIDPAEPVFTLRGRKSRDALLNAARKVFSENDYATARITDIVTEAGLSTGAFYRYFKDKDDILIELVTDLNYQLFQFSRSQSWSKGPHLSSVSETTKQYLALYRRHRQMIRVEIEVAQTNESVRTLWNETRKAFFDRIQRAVEGAQAAGLVRENVIPELAAALLGSMTEYYAYLAFILETVDAHDDHVVADQIMRIWGYGVLTAKGRAPVGEEVPAGTGKVGLK